MEQAEHEGTPDSVTRSQHLVYTLPQSADALALVLAPALERVEVTDGAAQVVIITPDAESAIVTSDVVERVAGADRVESVPVTSANRAARLIEARTVHVVAGAPLELQTLVQRSTLKLDRVKTVVLAWADQIAASGPDAVSSLEALFAEFPKEASRVIVANQLTKDVEQLIERYARNARRIDQGGAAQRSAGSDEAPVTVQCVTVTEASRLPALRRLLDDVDPPSAVVMVRPGPSEERVGSLLRQLGYRHADAPIRLRTEGTEPAPHTVIWFEPPTSRQALTAGAEGGVVQVLALVTPREAELLRAMGANVAPFTLPGASGAARQHDRMLRDEVSAVLTSGVPIREVMALEPLLEQHDGLEIAAAAVRLLEQARAQQKVVSTTAAAAPAREERFRGGGEPRHDRPFGDRPKRPFEQRPKRDSGDGGRQNTGDRPPRRDFGDRPKRDFGDRPRRDFNDRPNRFRDDRNRRDVEERKDRDFSDRRGGRSGHPRHDRDDRRKRDFNRDDLEN